jgi:GNAT superfamily N-acetyltransferase
VLDGPGVSIYAEDRGRRSDIGVVSVVDDTDAGACRMRVLPDGVGLAPLDGRTPQLGIALKPAYQHRGLGEPLLREALGRAWRPVTARYPLPCIRRILPSGSMHAAAARKSLSAAAIISWLRNDYRNPRK